MLPEQLLTITARLLLYAAHHLYTQPAACAPHPSPQSLSRHGSLSRVAADPSRVSPIARLRRPPRGSPRGTVRCRRRPEASHEAGAGGAGEHRRSSFSHACTSRLRSAGTAPQLSPSSAFPAGNSAEFGSPPARATLEAPNRPPAVNHCRGVQHAHVGVREPRAPALPTGTKRHPQRALMAIAESEYVLVAEIFRICVFSSSYVAVSKRLTTSLLK